MDDDAPRESPPAQDNHPAIDPDAPQRVEVERMESEDGKFRYGRVASDSGGVSFTFMGGTGGPGLDMPRPPVVSTWICLALAWLFLGSKVPFTIFIGLPLDLLALILAAVCLSRGGLFTGVLVLLLGTVGSVAVYLVGLFRFLAMA